MCSLENYVRIDNVISNSEYPTANLFLYELYTVNKGLDNAWNSFNNFTRDGEKNERKIQKGEITLFLFLSLNDSIISSIKD